MAIRPTRSLLLSLGVLPLLLAACGSDDGSDPLDRSSTPRITTSSDDPDDLALLLTEADVEGIDGIGSVTVEDLGEAGVYENPDPRGPCGGKVDQPDLSGSFGRSFTAQGMAIFELVSDAGPEAEAYLDAQRADVQDPCGPYDSQTNVGTTQHVTDIEVLDLGDLDGVAWTSKIEVPGGTVSVGGGMVIVDGRVALVQAQGRDEVTAAQVLALFDAAATRLRSA